MVKVIRTTPIDRSKRTAKKGDVVGEINILPPEEKRSRIKLRRVVIEYDEPQMVEQDSAKSVEQPSSWYTRFVKPYQIQTLHTHHMVLYTWLCPHMVFLFQQWHQLTLAH